MIRKIIRKGTIKIWKYTIEYPQLILQTLHTVITQQYTHELTFQLTPAAINGIVSCRSTIAPIYTVFDAFHTV